MIGLSAFALMVAAIAAPNWVSNEGWVFFDLNSITRSDGNIFINIGHGVDKTTPPPPTDRVKRFRINCTRLEVEDLELGKTENVRSDHYFIRQVCS